MKEKKRKKEGVIVVVRYSCLLGFVFEKINYSYMYNKEYYIFC